MEKQYRKLRIWQETLIYLKRIHIETGESMIKIVDRLAREEWGKVQASLAREEEDEG